MKKLLMVFIIAVGSVEATKGGGPISRFKTTSGQPGSNGYNRRAVQVCAPRSSTSPQAKKDVDYAHCIVPAVSMTCACCAGATAASCSGANATTVCTAACACGGAYALYKTCALITTQPLQ